MAVGILINKRRTQSQSLEARQGGCPQVEFGVSRSIHLAHAAFALGGPLTTPSDALAVARRAIELGLTATVGLIHDGTGTLVPLSPEQRRAPS